jgi:hypothetical protein
LSPIRPNFQLPVAQPRPVRPEARAAQRAFFEAAVNRAPASAPASAAEPVRPVAAAARTTSEPGAQPQRYLRPGSLLDIKV